MVKSLEGTKNCLKELVFSEVVEQIEEIKIKTENQRFSF